MIEASTEAATFYARTLETLSGTGVPFLVGGAYAMRTYAGIMRETKDMDIFATPGDYPVLLQSMGDVGYEVEITDS